MQAKYESFFAGDYNAGMQTGRPTSRQRPPFGERLYALREAAGLSQQQVADRLGMKHSAYAWWERHPVALRPDQIGKLTEILNVSVDELFSKEEKNGRRGGGPVGKARRLFEAVSKLPRSQQQHVLTVVEAFVEKKAAAAQ